MVTDVETRAIQPSSVSKLFPRSCYSVSVHRKPLSRFVSCTCPISLRTSGTIDSLPFRFQSIRARVLVLCLRLLDSGHLVGQHAPNQFEILGVDAAHVSWFKCGNSHSADQRVRA